MVDQALIGADVTENNETRMRDLPEAAQAAISRQFTAISEATTVASMTWGFEVVKHLAVFNGGGLAAAAAIAQAASAGGAARSYAFSAAHLFVFGLMVAVVTMLSVYILGFFMTRTFPKNVILVILSELPLSSLVMRKRFWVWVAFNWLLTVTSIALFFAGALKIVGIA